ncbi:GNAT family N-acetyltransferase [Desulfovibrio sp. OttesenSCG-928-G15]|nr:GNAT family N-acetyltransferase [Desulfovibrio sp. OttesenSCG-928-G15]
MLGKTLEHITPATAQDAAAIQTLAEEAFALYLPRMNGQKPAPMLGNYAQLIAKELVYVLKNEHALCGYLVIIPDNDTMWLDIVAVAKSHQGRGYGRKLITFAEQSARNSGFSHMRLYTNVAMTENIGLYTRLGYTSEGVKQVNGYERVYMVKGL